jgi:hypothetical protein
MKRLLLGFALLALPWAVWADDIALYKVELIVFENLDPSAINAEAWPENPGTPPLDNAVDLATITTAPGRTWQWLDHSQLGLNAQVRRLEHSQHYKTILHVGWIQPVDSSDKGQAVHIFDGMAADHGAADAQARANVPPEAQTTTAAPRILDGTFTLREGRFLHVDVDLGYTKTVTVDASPPASDAAAGTDTTAAAPPPQTKQLYVRMTQSRRIHSGELHYLDHPLFGVLFEVAPYDNGGDDGNDAAAKQSQ